jgi:hypothetical protein
MQKFELLHRAAENGLLVIERDCLVFFFFSWMDIIQIAFLYMLVFLGEMEGSIV